MRLTKPNVAGLTLPPGKTELLVFDDALPGFGLRIRAGGKRTWIAQYRVGSKQRRVSIGTVEALSADKAREAARGILAKVQLGGDPQTEKSENRARASVTLGTVAKRYLQECAKPSLKPRSYSEVERHLIRHWSPLRELPIHKVQRADVAARISEIARENGLFAANRARASLSALFTWAMGEGLADLNPVVGTNKATEEVSRHHVLTDKELAAIWSACGEYDYGRIVRLLILTGQRRQEVGGASFEEIDFGAGSWTIAIPRTKNLRAHEVPLSAAALVIIQAAQRRTNHPTLFGRGSDRGFQGWSKAKRRLDERIEKSGVKVRPWRLHDLRRTVATRLGDRGTLPHVIEAILNHVSGHKAGVAGVYNRSTYAKEKREALDLWAAHIEALVNDEQHKRT